MRNVTRLIRAARCAAAAALLGALFPAAAQDQSSAPGLSLACPGSGSVSETQTTFTNEYDRKAKTHTTGTAQTMGKRNFSATVYVELSGAFGRVKLPSALLPLLSSGSDGWFVINELFVNENEITGGLRINALNKPKLRVDRTTGSINITGSFGEFAGECQAVDKNAPRRF